MFRQIAGLGYRASALAASIADLVQRYALATLTSVFATVGYRLLEPLTGGGNEYGPAPSMDHA